MANVLIIDDDKANCESITAVIRRMGHDVSSAFTLEQGSGAANANKFDVVLLDVRLPDGSGLDLLPRIRRNAPLTEVIIMTGFGDPDGAELAIKNGAWDYIQKPSSAKDITLLVTRALQYQEEKKNRQLAVALKRERIIGRSTVIGESLDLVAQAAGSSANVLITGESGTGKELFAMAIHQNSAYADKNFVVVDCSALPETLVESVLFGHEKGAYTGADRSREGLVAQADQGTLFLDEVGELPQSIQKTFLRVLQERRFRPVGGKKELQSDFRLVAATNRDLAAMAERGQFREDLLFRLRTLVIPLPSLRERKEDLKDLALYYIARLCEQYGVETKGVSPEFFDVLARYDWPGNVRELTQALERALASAGRNPLLYPKDLPLNIRTQLARESIAPDPAGGDAPFSKFDDAAKMPNLEDVRTRAVAEAERKYLLGILSHTQGDIPEACEISGLSRSRLYTLLKKHRIVTPHMRKN
ncbi:MAG: sigma-54 dependent transcriptional regulator [Deltaproteobacteria bacterium]|nr:sigma-54 dependent transcriptional regulator [Deltaproteobacteria bacterium]